MKKIAVLLTICGGLFYLGFPQVSEATPNLTVTASGVHDAGGNNSALAMPNGVKQLTDFARKFGVLPPLEWKLAFHEVQGEMCMAEFIPMNETLNDWSGLVCMQGFKGLAEDIEPERFLDTMAETYRKNCEGELVYQQLGSLKVDGLEAVHGLLGCTNMPNIHHASIFNNESYVTAPKGEMGYYTVVAGEEDLYLIHKSMRVDVFRADNPPITATNYREFMTAK